MDNLSYNSFGIEVFDQEQGFIFSKHCAIVERNARRTRIDKVVGVIVVANGTGLGLFELGVFDFF